MHRNSRLLFTKYAPPYFKDGMRVLEIAPDDFPSACRQAVTAGNLIWETLDIAAFVSKEYGARLTYLAENPYRYPIADGTFDLVLSANVIEHVPKPWLYVAELARVCKPGGHVITVNPTNWIFHQAPLDCWRIFPDGMRGLYESAGLATVLATYESVEPWYIPVLRTGRQLGRLATFRKPNFMMGEVLDTIAIGQKPV